MQKLNSLQVKKEPSRRQLLTLKTVTYQSKLYGRMRLKDKRLRNLVRVKALTLRCLKVPER